MNCSSNFHMNKGDLLSKSELKITGYAQTLVQALERNSPSRGSVNRQFELIHLLIGFKELLFAKSLIIWNTVIPIKL